MFESVMVLLLPAVPAPQVLDALLAYRLVYYVLPFGVALVLLSAHEVHQHRERLATVRSWARKSLDLVVPQAIALLVFGAGFVLLLILARGLLHRLDAAWHVTMWLLGAGIAASLLKGLDYEEALLLSAATATVAWCAAAPALGDAPRPVRRRYGRWCKAVVRQLTAPH